MVAVVQSGLFAFGWQIGEMDEILSEGRLPQSPKAILGILMEIAKQKSPEKMTALYTKYKEKGLTRGQIRRIAAKPKPVDAPVDISFVPSWIDKLGALDVTNLPAEQKAALATGLANLRSVAYKKIMLLK